MNRRTHSPSEHDREVLRSAPIFARVESSVLDDIEREVDWIELHAGEVLFQQGASADGLYIAIYGRLEVAVTSAEGAESIVATVRPREWIGEMALLSDEQRSATVRAIRDSLLVRLSKEHFARLVARHPSALFAIVQLLIARLRTTSAKRRHALESTVFAVVPASRGAPIARVTQAIRDILSPFGAVLTVSSRLIDEALGGDITRLAAWLDTKEEEFVFLVLEADPVSTPWTERCLRHADHLLLVAESRAMEELVVDERLRTKAPIGAARRRDLVLVHEDGVARPSHTRRWLDAFEVDGHHHVRLGVPGDLRRLGRFITGRAVALVLGGGAARGAAHVGVIRALEEAGVPIDLVCGTSIGAVIGSFYALGADHELIYRQVREGFIDRSILDFTLPVRSLISAKRLDMLYTRIHGETQIEDLWRKYFCVSSNLSRASVVVHKTGSLRRAVRSSGALSGLFPPMIEGGDVLVDGVLLNNLPADRVQEIGPCITIAVNLVPALDQTSLGSVDETTSPLNVLFDRVNPFAQRRPPLLADLLMRAAFLGTVSAAQRTAAEVDLYIEPPLASFSFVDRKSFDPMVQIGYETAQRAIASWREREGSIPED